MRLPCTSPQFFTAVGGYLVGLVRRIPFVFELRDLWPVSIKAVGAMKGDSFAIRMIGVLEMFLYQHATRIVSVTNSFARVLADRGVDPLKIDVITNGVDLSRFHPTPKDEELLRQFDLNGKFVVGYIGTHGMAHTLETIVEAADRVKGGGDDDVRFLFLGHGARKQALLDMAKERGIDNIVFIDTVPRSEVGRYWSLLDASIIHLKKEETFKTVIPSKLFECMAMGIPILHGVEGESAEIVENNKVGVTFEPENAEELVARIKRIRNDRAMCAELKENCVIAAKKYERSHLAMSMLKSLEHALPGGCSVRGETS